MLLYTDDMKNYVEDEQKSDKYDERVRLGRVARLLRATAHGLVHPDIVLTWDEDAPALVVDGRFVLTACFQGKWRYKVNTTSGDTLVKTKSPFQAVVTLLKAHVGLKTQVDN